MKSVIQILILILLYSCSESQTINQEIGNQKSVNQVETDKLIKNEFIPDSSYLEYWCSIDILKKTSENLDELELTTVAEFLASFHKDCSSNIEYSKWANELLFELAKAKPDFLLQLLHKNDSFDKELIKSEFKNPRQHRLDLEEIINKIEAANAPNKIKEEIIKSLKITLNKQ